MHQNKNNNTKHKLINFGYKTLCFQSDREEGIRNYRSLESYSVTSGLPQVA